MASDAEVLIVGAGIAGLSMARALTLAGRTVEVIERAGEWSIEGSGLGLYPSALRVLDTLGLAEAIRASGHEVGAVRYFDRRGNQLAELTPPWAGLDLPYVEIRRRALHDVLIEGADVPVRMGTTVTHLERSRDALVVALSDQTTAAYRLVVGAEGIYSTMRARVAPVEPRYVGQMYWRGILDRNCGVEDITAWVGRSRFFGFTPVGDGRTRWFASIATENPLDSKEGTYERLASHFDDFCEPLPTILGLIAAGGEFHFGPAASVDCPRWFDRGVVVVGDAAHALSPVSGQGAAMAFEDAVVLAEELGGGSAIDDALAAFEIRRRPRIEALRRLVANRVAMATGRTTVRPPGPFPFDPWFDQSSLLSTPP